MFYISPSGNTILELANCFTYNKTITLIYSNRIETYSDEIICKEIPLNIKHKTIYKKKKEYTIMITIDWVGAPRKFLIDQGFSLLDNDVYKENIKENRKKKK